MDMDMDMHIDIEYTVDRQRHGPACACKACDGTWSRRQQRASAFEGLLLGRSPSGRTAAEEVAGVVS